MSSQNRGRSGIFHASRYYFRRIRGVRWPLSIKIVIVVGIIFILQAIPFTGVFLMLFAASLWSAPLINLAIIVAGFEALTGRIPRWFILLPILWFGLYALAVLREEAGLVEAQDFVSASNAAAVPVRYDPARHDIVADGFADGLAQIRFLDQLLLAHRLPVVYFQSGRGQDRSMKAARAATGSLCDALAERSTGTQVKVRKVHQSEARRHKLEAPAPVCIVSFSEAPAREIISVGRSERIERIGGLSVRMIITSAEGDSHSAEIRGASAQVLKRLPLPVIGCALNSSRPSWGCFAGFWRGPMVWFGTELNERLAVKMALDLSQAPRRELGDAGNAAVRDHLAHANQRFDHRRNELVDAFLQDPDAFPRGHELFRRFKQEPGKLAPYADRLIAALVAADARERKLGRNAGSRTRAVADLVAQLPDSEIKRNGERIVAVLDGPRRRWWNYARPLMRRTAELGPAAMPMLVARLERHRRNKRISWPEADAMIALCRIGLPHAQTAGPKLLEIWRRRSAPRRVVRGKGTERRESFRKPTLDRADKHLYLALLRLGLRNEAGLPEPAGNANFWHDAWQSVSPNSPADVCEETD